MKIARASEITRPFRPRKIAWDRDTLEYLRTVARLSFPEIARAFRCDHTTVMWACQRLGVPTAPVLNIANEPEPPAPVLPLRIRVAPERASTRPEFPSFKRETDTQAQMWRDLLRADRQKRRDQRQTGEQPLVQA